MNVSCLYSLHLTKAEEMKGWVLKKNCTTKIIFGLFVVNIVFLQLYRLYGHHVQFNVPNGSELSLNKFLIIDTTTHKTTEVSISKMRQKEINPNAANENTETSEALSVSLFMRLTSIHKKRFYCDFLRTMVLFWPSSYGMLVLVFDKESANDRALAKIVRAQFSRSFSDRILEIAFEPLPRNHDTLLKLPWRSRGTGYNRQIWSSFYIDLYTKSSIIAWVDSDSAFAAAVTRHSMFNGTRLRVIGTDCTLKESHFIRSCDKSVLLSLGLPAVSDFMLHFPVYIYRNTFKNCRKYLIKRHQSEDFEEVYKYISARSKICPVTTVLNYAWHFERDQYDWSFKICSGPLDKFNRRFQSKAKIRTEDIRPILANPQLSVHTGKPNSAFESAQLILTSYCLSNKEAGLKARHCINESDYQITNSLILFKYGRAPETCVGNMKGICLDILKRHYRLVGSEIKSKKTYNGLERRRES
ncbi:uncharacterized protein LOC124458004 [Xenia sp. Carnegie-2017]|uniref:uncharacterized protein LOC124458004 n=1 Tax=Xenia sp. Carnegie-2017 TaxID=2897299 RepID=UPI001F049A88|nr:uncharacterized protein LOC124458004 [Xenia sp. Carnegie-2017]